MIKKIKDYEQDLNLKSEQAKFDYQRKIQDFNLYTTNKHKSYIEFYEQLLKANGYVTSLTGLINIPTFEEYNKNDLSTYLQKRKIPEGKINDILLMWDKDKELAKKEIFKYDHLYNINSARNALQEAHNMYWKSQLYFSDGVINKSKTIIDNLWKIQVHEEMYLQPNIADGFRESSIIKKIQTIRAELPDKLDVLIRDMKTELSIGYYKDNP